MKSNKQPELRFPGFREEWEQHKLGDITDSFSGGTPTANNNYYYNGHVPFIRSGEISYDTTELFITEEAIKKSSAKLVNKGDILYALYGATSGEVGISQIDGAINQAILAIKPRFGDDSYFISQWLRKQKQIIISTYLQGGQGNLSGGIVKKLMIDIPVSKEEQRKISIFFKQLDDTIVLHQQELTTLKETKQGFLQNMFPKEGERVPEIRFPGFTDDWEQRKFEDVITSIQTGTNLLGSKANLGIPLIKMGNIQRGYFSFNKLEFLSSTEQVEEKDIAYYGDFLFNTRNTLELVGKGATWFGESGKYAFNSNIARFKFESVNTSFFNYLYNTPELIKQVQARAVGTTSVAAVYPRDLDSIKFLLPKIDEQIKIGSFFKQLDDTIALHQRELDLLKETKKAFLQKMFV
ncbi:restriction endonuclease subunit S [Carnobacterium antarcticum]|uniref:Restriction endonuclease subunit S n=1 Tax=Carnobacterium antarcticum TaxID=2126436 RepID=A0ABW4NLM7_9LACT|nr:restriction endonuclease subunit S [Carnobacterium sp. CP1]ALV22233.1 Type I restriction-modification system, specificity subunit S [Carnobacterium sp. CP1]